MNKKSAALARMRHICQLCLPGEIFVSAILHELPSLVVRSAAAFFWYDEQGRISNCYASRLPYGAADFAYAASGPAPAPAHLAAINADFYRRVLDANQAVHQVHADVVAAGVALGRLYVYRRQDDDPILASDRASVDVAIRYIARGMTGPALPPVRYDGDSPPVVARDELMLCDASGTVVHATDGGRSLLLMASGTPIAPHTMPLAQARVNGMLKQFCVAASAPGDHDARPQHMIENTWGRFSLEVLPLSDATSARRSLFAIRLQHHRPASLHLLEAMAGTGLSARQREIALMVALGRSNPEVAAKLELSVNTVAYHMKCVFQKMGVRTRAGLLTKLTASSPRL